MPGVPLDPLVPLVARWVHGWAVARDLPAPERRGPSLVVDPRSPDRAVEVVLVEPGPAELEAAAVEVRGTWDRWLTTFTAEPPSWGAPAGLRVVRDDEVLMTCSLAAPDRVDGRFVVETDGDRARARAVVDGLEVCSGWVGVVGEDAVVDRVVTSPEHRRQGLGSALMGALTAWAVGRGARHGLLAASDAGQGLYRSLGWQVVARMTTLDGVVPDADPA